MHGWFKTLGLLVHDIANILGGPGLSQHIRYVLVFLTVSTDRQSSVAVSNNLKLLLEYFDLMQTCCS